MFSIKEFLKKAVKNNLISIKEYNDGLFIYVIYRIVWETKSHYILYAVDSEESAKSIIEGFKSDEYFYERVRLN